MTAKAFGFNLIIIKSFWIVPLFLAKMELVNNLKWFAVAEISNLFSVASEGTFAFSCVYRRPYFCNVDVLLSGCPIKMHFTDPPNIFLFVFFFQVWWTRFPIKITWVTLATKVELFLFIVILIIFNSFLFYRFPNRNDEQKSHSIRLFSISLI